MTTLLIILVALISVALIFIILVQNPKGGGISSAFGGGQAANQILGAANATDVLEKITWALAGALLVICLAAGVFFKGNPTGNTIGVDVNTTPTSTQPAGGNTQPQPNGQPTGTTTPPNQ